MGVWGKRLRSGACGKPCQLIFRVNMPLTATGATRSVKTVGIVRNWKAGAAAEPWTARSGKIPVTARSRLIIATAQQGKIAEIAPSHMMRGVARLASSTTHLAVASNMGTIHFEGERRPPRIKSMKVINWLVRRRRLVKTRGMQQRKQAAKRAKQLRIRFTKPIWHPVKLVKPPRMQHTRM